MTAFDLVNADNPYNSSSNSDNSYNNDSGNSAGGSIDLNSVSNDGKAQRNQIIWACAWTAILCFVCFLGIMTLWRFKLVLRDWRLRIVRRQQRPNRYNRSRNSWFGPSPSADSSGRNERSSGNRHIRSSRRVLDQSQVDEYPIRQYEGGKIKAAICSSRISIDSRDWTSEMTLECVICLEAIEQGDWVRKLPCHHIFHRACLDQWLTKRSCLCPLCKLSLFPDPEDHPKSPHTSIPIASTTPRRHNYYYYYYQYYRYTTRIILLPWSSSIH